MKERLDVLLVKQGYAPSREKAKAINFRYMVPGDIQDRLDFASVDVSFISLTKIVIPARNLLKEGGRMVCLIKPQFEAGRDKVGKKGVVREPAVHREVIAKVLDFASLTGFGIEGLTYSPVKGPEGNIEYLVYLEKKDNLPEEVLSLTEHEAERKLSEIQAEKSGLSEDEAWKKTVGEIVEQAHGALEKEAKQG